MFYNIPVLRHKFWTSQICTSYRPLY